MKTKEDILGLIKSLSKSEKRYFKLFVAKNSIGSSSHYVKMFDLIEKTGSVEQQIIQKIYEDDDFMEKQFRVYKYRLYKQILKSLSAFHCERTIDDQILEGIRHAMILYYRGLYPDAWKVLEKAEGICRQYEKFTHQMEIIRWKKKIINTSSIYGKINEENLSQFYNEEKRVNELINNQNEFWHIGSLIFLNYKTYGPARLKEDFKRYNTFRRNSFLTKTELAKSYQAKVNFYAANMHYCIATTDTEGAYNYAYAAVNLIEAHPHQIDEDPSQYSGSLHNLLFLTKQMKKYKEFFQMISKLKMMLEKYHSFMNENLRSSILMSSYNLELASYIDIGDFKKATQLLPEIEILLAETAIPNELLEYYFKFNIALLHFSKAEYNKALPRVNTILNENKTYIRLDHYGIVRIMQIIIHFEKGNMEVLPYLIKSFYRFLMNKKMLYKTERIFIHFMKTKINKISTSRELKGMLKQLKNEIEEVMKDPMEAQLTEMFDIVSWLESKITNRSFEEIVREKSGFYV